MANSKPLPPAKKKPPAARIDVHTGPVPVKQAPAKKFSIGSWGDRIKGEKIIIYADSGMGKTTLSAMAPDPVFLALDDGSSKIKHPLTSEPLKYIEGVVTFDDTRAVMQDYSLFDPHKSLVIDTGDVLELLGLNWTLVNVKHEKGYKVDRIEGYGYGKGYRHLYDTMKLPMGDIDALTNRGKNVILICQMNQVEIAHAGGENFLCDVPSLQPDHGKVAPSVWGYYVQQFDHVFKIGYGDIIAHEGKAASSGERVVFTQGQVHFKAKSRGDALHDYPVVSFSEPSDDSIWKFLFGK